MSRKISLLFVIGMLVAALSGCASATDTAAAAEAVNRVADTMESQSAAVEAASEAMEEAPELSEGEGVDIAAVAEELGVTEDELKAALGDPSQGEPDFEAAAEALGVTTEELESAMGGMMGGSDPTVDEYTAVINGIEFKIPYELFDWATLPDGVVYERQPMVEYTNDEGVTRWYEVVYVETGNLNWYQAAALAEDAGGYLACITSEGENSFVFEQVNDAKYFWAFDADGEHYGISIGPFLGGYQPEGSEEPDGGWSWLSGETWDYANWAVNLDDGVLDQDPRDNTQPNDSGDGQPIMGFGEMNEPVPTWGDYMDTIGTYGMQKTGGSSYGFVIEYAVNPAS